MLNIKNTRPTTSQAQFALRTPSVEAELINMLYQQANTALIGVIATASGIAAIFFNEISWLVLSIWLIAIYALSFIRYTFTKKFKAQALETIDHLRWGWLFTFFVFLSGLSWGAASIVFFTSDNLQLFNILTLIIITLSIGSLAVLSAFPAAYYLFVIPAMVPMIWRYLNIQEQYYMVFGLLLIVFYLSLFSIVRVNHRMLRDSVILRFENTGLIHQLTEEKEKAEKANISKTKFLASASHDMRQPLHAIGLFLGVLEDRVEKPGEKMIVKKIAKSTNALNDLLDSLLDISKLDAGVIQTDTAPFSINDLFDALENEFKSIANEKGLKISFAATQQWVNSDYRIIERITRNLISNAVRYTHVGGIVVGCRRYQGQTLLAVYDTGIGIAAENMEDIFGEFYQLHNPERDRSKGLGLGLAIVKRMAKLLDMPLYIKSIPRQGSVFGIIMHTYPKTKNGMLPTVTLSASETRFFDDSCILVIDDEAEIRESLSELLRGWHCRVISAASGVEAIHVLQKNNIQPDIILADYRLRDNETGIEAIGKVHSLYSAATIPAIIITGDTAPDRIREAKMSGYKILHKPVHPHELRALLAEMLA